MAVNHGAESGGGGIQIQMIKIMNDIEQDLCHLCCLGFRELKKPGTPVHVSPYGHNPGNSSQTREDFRLAYVTSVDDQVDSLEGLDHLGPQNTVSIGDDPNCSPG